MQTRLIGAVSILLIAFVPSLAQSGREPETDVREVITRFETALEKHDVQTIEALVSPDIVVFEDGRRNEGWQDFREHHLLPEFKSSRTQYRTEVVKIEATPSLAWGYCRMNRAYVARKDDRPDVWTIYVLRKSEGSWKIAVLDWSVRRIRALAD